MEFKPMSDEEIESLSPKLKPGVCDYEVLTAEETISKSNNPMIKIKLKVWDCDGKEGFVNDFLMEKIPWKLKRFCQSHGLTDQYEKGNLSDVDIFNKTGQCKIRPQKDNDKYFQVSEYLIMEAKDKKEEYQKAKEEPVFDDDIPF